MKRNTIWLAFLILTLCTAPAYANDTPYENTSLDLQAGRFQSDWSNDGLMVTFWSSELGYKRDVMYEPFLGSTPLVTVTAVRQAIERGYGWHHWSSHGHDCIAVEFYDNTGLRNTALTNYLNSGYTTSELGTFDIGTMHGIALKSAFFTHGTWNGSLVHFMSCQGMMCALGMSGVGAFVGYNYQVDVPVSQQEERTFYEQLTGCSTPQLRTADRARAGTTLSILGPGDIELAPMVTASDLVMNQHLTGSVTRYVHFSSPMNTTAPAASVVKAEGAIDVVNAAWQGNDQIVFTLKPKYRGDATISVVSDTTSSLFKAAKSYPGLISLVGNAHGPLIPGGPDGTSGWGGVGNYEIDNYSDVGGDNPAALVSAFRVELGESGVHGLMATDVESGSDSFFVQRSTSPTGPFTVAMAWSASGPRQYLFDDPQGRAGDWYEAWEVDTAGVRTRVASEQVILPRPIRSDTPITAAAGDSLVAMMSTLYPEVSRSSTSIQPVLNWAAIVPDETYRPSVQALVNKHNAEGLVSETFTMAEITSNYGSIQNFSKYWAPYGLRFLLRCGDANNWRYHNNPQYYYPATDWENYWYGSQPELDIMPLTYVIDPCPYQYQSTTVVAPEMPVLLDGDVNGDSLMDVAEGIMPCSSPAELALMVYKQIRYQQQSVPSNPHLTMYVDARYLMGNSGANARELADSIANAVRPQLPVTMLLNDDTLNLPYYEMEGRAVSDLATRPTMIMPFGVATTRTNWIALNKIQYFDWAYLPATTVYPFLDGWSCDLVDFDRSEDTSTLPWSPRPLFHDAMLDTLRGPACGVGPMRGTFIRGDYYAALAFHDIVLRHGAPSAGEAFVGAMHRVSLEHPEYNFQHRSFVYFGDPAAKIPGMQYSPTTAVGDLGIDRVSLTTPWPNPVRDRATVRFTVPTTSPVTLSLFDVQGRCVQLLASGQYQPGSYQQTLTMSTRSAGMYFLRLRVGLQMETQKMIVTR